MSKRILLSTYSLRLFYKGNDTILEHFDDKTDFLDFAKQFMEDLFQNIQKTPSFRYQGSLHLTLDNPVTEVKDDRILYGYLSSGIGGDDFTVRTDGEKKKPVFKADPNTHVTYRNLFFFLEIPRNKKLGYLIVQKKRDLGAKGSLEKAFNDYLKKVGYENYSVKLYSLLPQKVFDVMIKNGQLKQVDLIRRRIPSSIEKFYEDPKEYDDRGTMTTTIKSRMSLNDNWKDFVSRLYRSNSNATIELNDGHESYDEIEFKLTHNNKLKTFHILNKQRTQPDVDVTEDIEIGKDGEPTLESLVKACRGLITDIFDITPKDAIQN